MRRRQGYTGRVESGDMGKKVKIAVVAVALILSMLIISDIIFGELGMMELFAVRSEYGVLFEKKKDLVAEVARMENEVERLKNDLAYIEEIARGELGFVKKREKIIIINE